MIPAADRSRGIPPLVRALCIGAIAIGLIVLTGYALGSASLGALGTNGKPAAAVTAVTFIVLATGILSPRRPAFAGFVTLRRAGFAAIVIAAASLSSTLLSRSPEEWQTWGARGGVYLLPFPITAVLILALGSASVLLAKRWELTAHVIASATLLVSVVFLFGYILRVPSFIDPTGRLAPVVVTSCGLLLLSTAAVLMRPRGWGVPLMSRTSAGAMTRLLLPAILVVPFASIALNHWLTEDLGHTPQVGLTTLVAVNVFFGAAILLGAGAALHRRESDRLRLAAIVHSSADAIAGMSNRGIIQSWNGGAEQIYGYTAAEAIGRSIGMLSPPERQDETAHLLERAWRGERVEPMDTTHMRKDGRRVDVLLSISPVRDHDGHLVGASAIAHDITARKRTEEALRRSEAALAEAQHIAHVGSAIVYPETGVIHASDEYFGIFDLDPDPGTPLNAFLHRVHEDDRTAVGAALRAAVTSGSFDAAFRIVRGDGSIRNAHGLARARLQNESSFCLIGTVEDVTERNLAENALREHVEALRASEQQYRTLFDAIDEGFCVIEMLDDADGNPADYRFLEVNPAFERQTGLHEAVGRTIREMVPDHEAYWFETYGRVSRTGEAIRFEHSAAALQRYYDVFAFRIGGEGSQRVGVLFNDIAERKRTEDALRDSEAALAEAQEIAQIGSWILYPESGEASVSPETFRIFGIEPRSVVQMPKFLDLILEEDRPSVAVRLAETVATRKLDVEFRVATQPGIRLVRAVARKRESGESRLSMIGTIQDITDLRATEESLRQQTAALERSNADLERFNRAAVGRELRMIELKKQINDLCTQSGRQAPYVLPEEQTLAKEAS